VILRALTCLFCSNCHDRARISNLVQYISCINQSFACLLLPYPFLFLRISSSSAPNDERTRVQGNLIHRPGCWSGAVMFYCRTASFGTLKPTTMPSQKRTQQPSCIFLLDRADRCQGNSSSLFTRQGYSQLTLPISSERCAPGRIAYGTALNEA
jgi:hypothetical protein